MIALSSPEFTLEDIIVSRAIQDISIQQRLQSSRETEKKEPEPIQSDKSSAEIIVKKSHASVLEPTDNSQIIKSLSIIEKLKDLVGISKEVKEIKISVTENELYEKSREVAKKKFLERKIVPVTILYFRGRDLLYSTHQAFLQSRAVYMLVINGSRSLNEPCKYEVFIPGRDGAVKTHKDYVKYCINTIYIYCRGEIPGFPKIMIILTHKDKLKVVSSPPYWFTTPTNSSVTDYIAILKENSYHFFELRLMLQGEPDTGKSTIARFLIGMQPSLFRNSTDLYTGLSLFDSERDIWLSGKKEFTLEDIIVSRAIQDISIQQRLQSSRETEKKEPEPIQSDKSSAEIIVKKSHASVLEPTDNSQIIKSLSIIEKLKDLVGISKEVKEIKISVTENELYEKSREVAKKKFLERKIVPVTILYFRGRDLLYSTHQAFLQSRAVYMLVINGSRSLNEPCKYEVFIPGRDGAVKTHKDYVKYCINTIYIYCRGEIPGFPKIMIILTHKDKLKVSEIERRRNEIFGEIEAIFDGSPIKHHVDIDDRIFVNAKNINDPEMEKMKHSLIKQAKTQPTWGQKLPKSFLPLELQIQYLKKQGCILIHIEYIKKINAQQAIRPLTNSELNFFLKFQHSLGEILYFGEPYLDQHIIISPPYLIDAFQSIITDKHYGKGDIKKENAWYSMDQKGIILKQSIETIWKQQKYAQFQKSISYLLKGTDNCCDSFCPVADENFLLQAPNDLHLRRLALEYNMIEVRKLVTCLGLHYSAMDELCRSTSTDETIRIKALKRCSEQTAFTFKDLKIAAEKEDIQNPHIICKVLRDKHISFDAEPEMWDLTPTDEDIDKLSSVVNNRSLDFLIELGLTFKDWEQIWNSQTDRHDLTKLNRAIMEAWLLNCKLHNINQN